MQIHMKGAKVNNYLDQEKMKSDLLRKEDEELMAEKFAGDKNKKAASKIQNER